MLERATQNFFCGENFTFIFISEIRARVLSILSSDRYVVVFVERNASRFNVVSFFFGVAFEKKKKNKKTVFARD